MTTNDAPIGQGDPLVYAAVALAAVVLGTDASLYGASRVVGDRPTPGSPTALLVAVQHGYRPSTPVAVLASVLLLALLSALVWLLLWWTGRRTRGSSTPARWATRKDLATLAVGKDPKSRVGRIGLGETDPGGRWLAAEPKHSVCVLGPAGSGKTVSVVIPTLLDWDGPAVCTSVKTDVVDATEARRRSVGPVSYTHLTLPTKRIV